MRRALFCLLALFSFPVLAGAVSDSVYLEDLTWQEIRDRMDKGADTVIIPTGGTEQNGPHIVIGKHNRIVHATSGEIARQLGNALAAPVLAYTPEGNITPPEGHMKFPGTVSLKDDAFSAVLEDIARSFKQAGFKRICFIGDHGGNQAPQAKVAAKLNKEWQESGVRVLQVGDYYAANGSQQWVKMRKLAVENPAAHAGFMDTSEVMALDPNGVRPERIKVYDAKNSNATGVMGDPSLATADYGRMLLELKVMAAVEQIRRMK